MKSNWRRQFEGKRKGLEGRLGDFECARARKRGQKVGRQVTRAEDLVGG